MTSPDARAGRRRPAVLGLLVILGAAAAASASGLTWWTQTHVDALAGALTTKATGSRTDSLLLPVALMALAGLGAALATTGMLRRGVGALLLLGGLWSAAASVAGLVSAPAVLTTDLTRPAESSGAPQVHVIGPLLGVLGGGLIATAGVLVVLGYGSRKGLGARYEAPTRRRTGAPSVAELDPASDPNVAVSWWKALDAGLDPTGSGRRADTGDPTAEPDPTEDGDPTRSRPPARPGVSDDITRGG
ncbi:trp region conserved hypothetical membrane protein [Nakamurella panacisegetis]|uniref:Trp region conserved hypothetical membrane protein n=1 Tax=Nakamurella panacisegetis TaxID=1090615 RepID=A0A1H0RPZ5_9ACTN|nr:Trp biosynthesis-associated membrane protein [Nakamurella panacisegetis]SDP31048.1 trp region conserved hypothetical membrane protein [Nakamurella panacisegetis]